MRTKNNEAMGGAFTKKIIGWDIASSAAKDWWGQLESINEGREDLVIKLVAELISRQATIEDFFWACSYSGKEGVKENLKFLDIIKQDFQDPDETKDPEPFLH